jgi:hypothetical protein
VGVEYLRVCKCGCNRSFPVKRSDRLYFEASCRKRASREARGELVPSLTKCACGCGELTVGRRKKYFSDACRQRAYRKRKEFDEFGPDYDWSERPETPRKSDMQGYRVDLNY